VGTELPIGQQVNAATFVQVHIEHLPDRVNLKPK
jgi:hypothetical protein